MLVYKKLLCAFLLVSILPLTINFVVGLFVQQENLANFSIVAEEQLPGTVFMTRMIAELYRIKSLLPYYQQKDPRGQKEIEQALASMDAYYATHQLYHRNKNKEDESVLLPPLSDISGLISQYIFLVNQNRPQKARELKQRLDSEVNTFIQFWDNEHEKQIAASRKLIKSTKKYHDGQDGFACSGHTHFTRRHIVKFSDI